MLGSSDKARAVRKALLLALVLNGAFLVVEAVTGWLTGSLALLADAAHMLSDVGALAFALGAAHLASRPSNERHTFGLGRAETLAAFVNGLTLIFACAWIFFEAAERLVSGPPPIAGVPALIVAAIGLLINLGSAWVLSRADRDNLNVRGALLHMLADALGSVGAIIGAAFAMAGMPTADPIVSVLIGALVLWGTWGLLRESGRVLLQLAPRHLDAAEIRAALCELRGVVGVHDLHLWTLSGRRVVFTAHIDTGEAEDLDRVRREAQHLLHERFDIDHTTLQVEHDRDGSCEVDCGPEVPNETDPPQRLKKAHSG